MFVHRIVIILYIVATVIESKLPQLNWLKDETAMYCIISNETESTAMVLLNGSVPIKGTKYRLTQGNFIDMNLNCDVSTDQNCKDKLGNSNIWKYDTSDNYDFPPILDRRWEDFNIIETGKINFVSVRNFTGDENEFAIKISVKIYANMYIFLCDGANPRDSNCYWFIIGGWKGNHSIIRKCSKGMISDIEGVYTACNKHPNKEKEPRKRDHGTPPTSTNWTHFMLRKTENKYFINRVGDKEPIVSYEKDATEITIKHLLIGSLSDSPGIWKLDDSSFEYTTGGGFSKPLLLGNNKSTIKLNFSVKHPTKGAAFIYICNSETSPRTPCYRIELRHNNNKNIVCIWRNGCQEIRVSLSRVDFLSWTHFTLEKKGTSYKIIYNGSTILEFNNNNIVTDLVYFGSSDRAYWKFHSYGILVGNTTGNTTISIVKGKKGLRICVAVFTYTSIDSNLTLGLGDGKGNLLISKQPTKRETWEEIKLWTILDNDTSVDLEIYLNITNDGQEFIGDIRDCSKNLRTVKVNYNKTINTDIACKTLKTPGINASDHEKVLVVPALNESFSDVVWIKNENSLKDVKAKIQCALNVNDSSNFVCEDEICFVTIKQNNLNGNDTCIIYEDWQFIARADFEASHLIGWTFIAFAILCCCGIMGYLIKKHNISYSSAFHRTYSFITTMFPTPTRESPLLQLCERSYENFSTLVPKDNFRMYLNTALKNGELLEQYNAIKALLPLPKTVGLMAENVRKNRFKNITAYDATRVKLESTYSNVNDDYINANYIRDFEREKAFIATQGPLPTTINDFWQMIWQENVPCIVMLSKIIENGGKKSEKYWPELNDTYQCCAFKITCTKSKLINEDVTLRSLKVVFNSIEREVTQIHYEGWLDHDTPDSPASVVNILTLMTNFGSKSNPTVVHCSAGVGRTGTLILCALSIKMAQVIGTVDPFFLLYELRQQRLGMVQNYDQYVFAHEVIDSALKNI